MAVVMLSAGCQSTRRAPPAAGNSTRAAAPTSQPTYETYISRGREQLKLRSALHQQMFQIDRAAWDVDQLSGFIRFESPGGVVTTAPVQILGTYADGTWTWAWANPGVSPKLTQEAELLRGYGQGHGVADLTVPKLACDAQHCWDFVAADIAMNGATGAYAGTSGDTIVFMTFGAVTTSKPQ